MRAALVSALTDVPGRHYDLSGPIGSDDERLRAQATVLARVSHDGVERALDPDGLMTSGGAQEPRVTQSS